MSPRRTTPCRAARRHAFVFFGAVFALLLEPAPGRPALAGGVPQYEGSAAEAAARGRGWTTLRVLRADLTGDGRRDDVVVRRRGRAGLELVVFVYAGGDHEDDPEAFRAAYTATVPGARQVARLEARSIAGDPSDDVLAVFEAAAPDERLLTVRIVGRARSALTTFFERAYIESTDEARRPIQFGEGAPHFILDDLDRDGAEEILWTLGAQTLQVDGPAGPVEFVIGARRQTLSYEPESRVYVASDGEELVDFLPPHTPTAVEATAQVPKIWGTAQAFWGADGDLETTWTVRRANAVGQALTVRFADRPRVSMIRVVPGCGASAEEWSRYATVARFRIHLSNGTRFEVRADGRGAWPAGVRGRGIFPLEGDFGRQLLLFLDEPSLLEWGRLEIVAAGRPKAPKTRRIDEVCLSEISFH